MKHSLTLNGAMLVRGLLTFIGIGLVALVWPLSSPEPEPVQHGNWQFSLHQAVARIDSE